MSISTWSAVSAAVTVAVGRAPELQPNDVKTRDVKRRTVEKKGVEREYVSPRRFPSTFLVSTILLDVVLLFTPLPPSLGRASGPSRSPSRRHRRRAAP